MAPTTYKLKELLALRGNSQIGFERHFIDSMNDRGECSMLTHATIDSVQC